MALGELDTYSQWDRREVGRRLRTHGWTYAEIGEVLPAAKSTIAGWCRDIQLNSDQTEAIADRTGSRRGVPRDTQWRRRIERSAIIDRAAAEVECLTRDPQWIQGVVLYWAEGNKTENALGMSNSDPHLHRAFMAWTRDYHDPAAVFRASLNLHADNDEPAARAFWALELGLDDSDFNQTFIKPDGTGQRRNHLPHGVAKIRVRKSTDMFLTTMGWIDGLRRSWDTQSH